MHIAIVGPTHPIKGGVSQHTTVLARRLAEAGHEVEIVSWSRQYPKRLYPGRQTVDEREFEAFEPTRRVLAWNRPDSWLRAARRIRDFDVAVFAHITPVQVPAYRAMMLAMRGGRARVIVVCHNVVPHERMPLDRLLVRSLLGAADRVVVHSDSEARLAAAITGTQIVTAQIAPFMPVAFRPAAPVVGEQRRLLFFGLVRPYKGLDVLLRALAAGPSDVRLRVAGEFWGGTAETEALCQALGIADRVELVDGYVAAGRVPDLFADVDALVLPYRSATGSQGVWTGFEFGVPVIATRAGHLADDIRDGVDGLIAEPDDEPSLRQALQRFYQPGVPEELRRNVRSVDAGSYWQAYLAAIVSDVGADGCESVSRKPQLAYSEVQAKMLDERHRRTKARKIIKVLHHYLGRTDLKGLLAVDIGCSAGFISDELAADSATTVGVDIDVPGIKGAQQRFGSNVDFICGSGDALPLPDDSVDIVVFNHIYEHVVDADAVLTEIHRVLKPDGVAYLGLGNKYQVMEPHYRLPFLSWLPQRLADKYVSVAGRADEYYESYRSRSGLQHMLRGFHVWDYTIPVVLRPDMFGSADQIRGLLGKVSPPVARLAMPIIPTFIWLATKSAVGPRTAAESEHVVHLDLSGLAASGAARQ